MEIEGPVGHLCYRLDMRGEGFLSDASMQRQGKKCITRCFQFTMKDQAREGRFFTLIKPGSSIDTRQLYQFIAKDKRKNESGCLSSGMK